MASSPSPRDYNVQCPIDGATTNPPLSYFEDDAECGVPILKPLPSHPQPTGGRIIGSDFFHAEERIVFSKPTLFRILIEADFPNSQAAGGPYTPLQFSILPRWEISPSPLQMTSVPHNTSTYVPTLRQSIQLSPQLTLTESRLQTTPISPFPEMTERRQDGLASGKGCYSQP
jgi:hypothetical protein